MDDLQRDVRLLSAMLDSVIARQAGAPSMKRIESLRQLSRERRAGLPGAEDRLVETIGALSDDEIRVVIPALILFFDLANMAEDMQRVRVLRDRERQTGSAPRSESIRDAVLKLRDRGLSSRAFAELFGRFSVDLVFTAHPTEAKRRTTRRLIRSLREALQKQHSTDLLDVERDRLVERMRSDLTILSQIDLLRPQPPTVRQEVERGLFFIEELWQVVPRIDRELRAAAAEVLHHTEEPLRPFLKFGSWIGGDRDGHPYVTPAVTADTLATLRRAAIRRHLTTAHDLFRVLVMTDRSVTIPQAIGDATDEALRRWPELVEALDPVIESERYRRWLRVIEWRLLQTIDCETDIAKPAGAYDSADDLLADVRLLAESLAAQRGEAIVAGPIDDWIAQVQTFGLHFAALDVRQDSRVHVEVMTDFLAGFSEFAPLDWVGARRYSELDEPERLRVLAEFLKLSYGHESDDTDPDKDNVIDGRVAFETSESTTNTVELFRVLATTIRDFGLAPLGGHVISMTHHLSDVLTVLCLWKWAWQQHGLKETPLPHLPIIPLFETIDDLARAADVLDAMLSDGTYRAYVDAFDGEPTQTVMVGYSDSTKDGGYLAASWGLHRAQERLAAVAQRHGVRLIVFHGRGGALGRGGGPAARAILSLPSQAVGGALRMTEQGEVLAERYDDPEIAHRHLEQVSWATLLVSADGGDAVPAGWSDLLEAISATSFGVYRRLVEHPGFLSYFDLATPIAEIENLPIGSRPARRRERRSLDDLRAIPWTFAWTQNRHILPAWYGIGSALETHVESAGHDWSHLQEMYERWPLFRAIIDNAELALAKADMGIAHRYATLAPGDDTSAVWRLVGDEFARSRAAVLLVTRQQDLLGGIPWLQRSIRERNPYVDPLNLIQIELIRRLRSLDDDASEATAARAEQLRGQIRLTIQGVAAGLRTTG